MIGSLTNHLWQSTLFAVAAGLLTVPFRTNKAQVRYWLWFTASVKFLLPFALLLSLGSHLEWSPSARTVATPVVSDAVLQIAQPFPVASSFAPPAPHAIDWVPIAIFIWACGFVAIAVIRLRGWLRVRAAVRSSIPLDLPGAIAVRSSPGLLEPGVVGFLHPVLLLPAGIQEQLTPRQLEAVLAHELCHVRRRDNLTSAVHMVVEAVFWFHPFVWWIGARLVEERERACDEAVLSLGGEPQIYAEGILTVCKNYLESPLRCVSGVTGADLKKRIHTILTGRVPGSLNIARKTGLAVAGAAALALPLLIGVMNAPAIRAQSAARPRFEVTSVKPCRSGDPNGRSASPIAHGRMNVSCMTVMYLMKSAYVSWANGHLNSPNWLQIEGGPGWINSELYTINAKSETDAPFEMLTGPMLQGLLEDRFKLKTHRETREIPVYSLTAAKGGPRLRPVSEGSCTPFDQIPVAKFLASQAPGEKPLVPCDTTSGGVRGSNVIRDFHASTMAQFAAGLRLDRPVIDKTGITGMFDFHLEFALDETTRATFAPGAPATALADDPGGPSIFTAIQEQLGLKLDPARGPGEFLVIDSVERPAENQG